MIEMIPVISRLICATNDMLLRCSDMLPDGILISVTHDIKGIKSKIKLSSGNIEFSVENLVEFSYAIEDGNVICYGLEVYDGFKVPETLIPIVSYLTSVRSEEDKE